MKGKGLVRAPLRAFVLALVIGCSAPTEDGEQREPAEISATSRAAFGRVAERFGARWLPAREADTPGSQRRIGARVAAEWRVESAGGLEVRVAHARARDVAREDIAGYAFYRDGLAPAIHLLAAETADGVEDYVAFERAPANSSVDYRVELGGVAGLRLIANTLEFLDSAGAPRLRMAPPLLVDREKQRVFADVSVVGCAYDNDPRAPWGRPVTAPGASACTIRVSWSDDIAYPALLDPAWTTTGSLPNPKARHSATLLADGRVLAAGGVHAFSEEDDVTSASALLYDPASGTWAATGSLPAGRTQHSAVLLNDGRVLVAGGSVWNSSVTNSLVYSPTTGTWSTGPTMNRFRYSRPGIARLAEGRVLVVGGASETGTTAEVYNPTSNTWTLAGNSSVHHDLARVTLTQLNDGRFLVTGGNNSEIYDPAASTFSTSRTRNSAYTTATLLADGRVLGLGGGTYAAALYDPSTHVWKSTAPLARVQSWPSATLLSDGAVLVTGGTDVATGTYTGSEIFAPGSNLTESNSNTRAVKLSSGKILLVGGESGWSVPTNRVHVYEHVATPVVTSEYKFAPENDPSVASIPTELWATVYRPQTLVSGKSYPLVLFIHGRHDTCRSNTPPYLDDNNDYATTGACPTGYTVIRNQDGYAYAAEELARRDFIVVSINWNRLVAAPPEDEDPNDSVLRLVDKHLKKLSAWNAGTEVTPSSIGTSLQAHLDFTNVGAVGHSRGALVALDAANGSEITPGVPLDVKVVVALAGVDAEDFAFYSNPTNVKWVGVIAYCDNDSGDTGVRPFDRVFQLAETQATIKSTWAVRGANHNFFNSEWHVSESTGCAGPSNPALFAPGDTGSVSQRQTGFQAIVAAILGNVGPGADSAHNRLFDPLYPLPLAFPRIDRGYLPSSSSTYGKVLENFDKATGINSSNNANTTSNVTVQHRNALDLSFNPDGASAHASAAPLAGNFGFARITWTSSGTNRYFQANVAASGSSTSLSSCSTLDFRVDRTPSALNSTTNTSFSVSLVTSSGTESNKVTVGGANAAYVRLDGPSGVATAGSPEYRAFFQTARIPLSAFTGISLSSVRSVRFTFSGSTTGEIFLSNVRASKPSP
jgi:hypothetical protein